MKRPIREWFIAVCLAVSLGVAARAGRAPQQPADPTAGPQRYQLVLFKLGPSWQKGKPLVQQPGIKEHAAFMLKLIRGGILVLGGPLVDDENQVFTGAMMVLALGTPEAARQALAADPAIRSELYLIDKIETMIITGTSWKPAVPKE